MMVIVTAVGFPILQANRLVRDERGVNATRASENIGESIRRAIEASGRANTGPRSRADCARAHDDEGQRGTHRQRYRGRSPFQNGYTLTPMITVFIPRVLWSDKPAIPTGQILNRTFHVSEATETFISPSHLGELYCELRMDWGLHRNELRRIAARNAWQQIRSVAGCDHHACADSGCYRKATHTGFRGTSLRQPMSCGCARSSGSASPLGVCQGAKITQRISGRKCRAVAGTAAAIS